MPPLVESIERSSVLRSVLAKRDRRAGGSYPSVRRKSPRQLEGFSAETRVRSVCVYGHRREFPGSLESKNLGQETGRGPMLGAGSGARW